MDRETLGVPRFLVTVGMSKCRSLLEVFLLGRNMNRVMIGGPRFLVTVSMSRSVCFSSYGLLFSIPKNGGGIVLSKLSFSSLPRRIAVLTHRGIALSTCRSIWLNQGYPEQQKSISDTVAERWTMCHNFYNSIPVQTKLKYLLADTMIL